MTLQEMKRIKEEQGYSLAQLSERSGIPTGTLQKIFSGETKVPRYATRQALERALVPDMAQSCRYPTYEELQWGKKEELLWLSDSHASDYKEDIFNMDTSGQVSEAAPKYGETVEKKQGEYTIEDYYALPEDRRVELIDGVFYEMLAPGTLHQRMIAKLFYKIFGYIEAKGGGCIPFLSPVDVRLDCDDRTVVEPDLLILCDRDKITQREIMGAPDFVLEVISKSTARKDYIKKTQKYLDAGVREYWILDPNKSVLVRYDEKSDYIPQFTPLKGTVGLAIYDGDLQIDLDEIAAEIEGWPK